VVKTQAAEESLPDFDLGKKVRCVFWQGKAFLCAVTSMFTCLCVRVCVNVCCVCACVPLNLCKALKRLSYVKAHVRVDVYVVVYR